ncbi:MAG: PhzF family phenazine biosynthesis protein [Phycisphaerales bacterium]|nr:PhzF family phenazine biosynthesis protein [Phycisphaerales bacterium]
MRIFHVDAFTNRLFSGNPACVVPLQEWISEHAMQAIAAENNVSETAFFAPEIDTEGEFRIRWFTPTCEVDLCGHATLATAHVLIHHLKHHADQIRFESASGVLRVNREGDRLVLDFPSRPGEPAEITDELVRALGIRPSEAYRARDVMCVYQSKKDILALQPDMDRLARVAPFGLIATAPAVGHDFVCRFFAPAKGVDEDPVTGSAHCTLIPYWANRLKKHTLVSHQISKRAGELFCRLDGDRVHIGGACVTYSEGSLAV